MRGRAGAAVRRRPVGRLCPWPVSCEKYETGYHSSLQIRDRRARSTRNFKLNFGARRRDGRRHESPTGHAPGTCTWYAIRAFGFERSQSSKLKLAA